MLSTAAWYSLNRVFCFGSSLAQKGKISVKCFPKETLSPDTFPKGLKLWFTHSWFLLICFSFISFLALLNVSKMHAIEKYILEDTKGQNSWLFPLLAVSLLFTALAFPGLKRALHDSFLSTLELHPETGSVPPVPCSVEEEDIKFFDNLSRFVFFPLPLLWGMSKITVFYSCMDYVTSVQRGNIYCLPLKTFVYFISFQYEPMNLNLPMKRLPGLSTLLDDTLWNFDCFLTGNLYISLS